MMDRAEKTGFGVALVGHAALLAALTFGLATLSRAPIPTDAIEVSFVDNIDLTSAAPVPAAEPPPSAAAPDAGPPEEVVPEPAALPAPRPEPRPVAPAPSTRPQPSEQSRRQPRRTAPRRSNLPDISSFGAEPSASRSRAAPAAAMTGQAAASIAQAIQRQVQPCADRQVYPGPGSERIVTPVVLRLNRDGSLAARPRVGQQRGLDDENSRYADRVADLAIAAFVGCSPLRGLPAELYDVPRGWSNFTMNYRMPG